MVPAPRWLQAIPDPPPGYRGCDNWESSKRERCRTVVGAATDLAQAPRGAWDRAWRRRRLRRVLAAPDAAAYLEADRKRALWDSWVSLAFSEAGYRPDGNRSRLGCDMRPAAGRGGGARPRPVWLPARPAHEIRACRNIRDRRLPAYEAFFRRYVAGKRGP